MIAGRAIRATTARITTPSFRSPKPPPLPELPPPELWLEDPECEKFGDVPATARCPGGGATKGLVLGTDFITDVLLVAIRVDAPITLVPGVLATDVALRTICEAVTKSACARLELEANELQAEYPPALPP